MNKTELVNAMVEKGILSRRDAETALDEAIEIVSEALLSGDVVKIAGFGIFEKKTRAARVGTNPANGEKITIPASNAVSFKPSKNFKEKLNG